MTRNLHYVLGFALLAASPLQAQTWDPIGAGSGTPPGIFNITTYDPSIPAGTQASNRPVLATAPGGRLVLLFNSRTTNTSIILTKTYAVGYGAGAWNFLPGNPNGRLFADLETKLDWEPVASASTANLVGVTVGAPELSLINDVYASFYGANGWQDRGGSLGTGGITDSTAFGSQVYEAGASIDPNDRTTVAYSLGSATRRRIYVQRLSGTVWGGIAGSDVTPIADSPTTSITNIHPSVSQTNVSPVVAWTYVENTINETVKLLRHDPFDNTWKGLGASATTGLGAGRHPKAVNLLGRSAFFVAFENRFDGALSVQEWTGAAWLDRGSPLQPWGLSRAATFDEVLLSQPSLASFDIALDSFGRPVVAFRAESPAQSGKYHIFASYRNAAGTWVALGSTQSGLGADGLDYSLEGAQGPVYGHYNPTLTIGLDNRPNLAWEFDDATANPPVILARRFSNPTATPTANASQAIAILLGQIDSSPAIIALLDSNEDGRLDAADVERLPK